MVSTNGATKILTLNLGGYLSSSHEAGKVGNANVALGAFDINTRTVTLQNNNGVTAVLSVDIGGNLNKGADGVITMPILNAWSPLVLKLTDSGGTIQNLASQNYTEIIKKRPPQTTTNKKEKKNANTHASTDHFVRARWRVCRRQLDIHISMTVPQAAERGASTNIRRLPQNPSLNIFILWQIPRGSPKQKEMFWSSLSQCRSTVHRTRRARGKNGRAHFFVKAECESRPRS